ncbi:hypothetical protein FQN57_006052 [Myotisia sp. PD_48]|nr:hypothetical protein FQN57_006052 [Myotisia sp. PD_48]
MHFNEAQVPEVKSWVVKKLEDISDADSDVLADYVLALIQSDAPDAEIRKASVENLEDFLKESMFPLPCNEYLIKGRGYKGSQHIVLWANYVVPMLDTVKFVDEIFDKYNPQPSPQQQLPPPPLQQQQQPTEPANQQFPLPSPAPAIPLNPQVIPEQNLAIPVAYPPSQIPSTNQPGQMFDNGYTNRKRTYHDSQGGEDREGYQRGGDRPYKSMRGRRGGRGGAGGWDRRQPGPPNMYPHNYGPGRGAALGQPGMPPFNPNDPMMQHLLSLPNMGFPQIPGMPPMPQLPVMPGQIQNQPPIAGSPPVKIAERCKDYDTMGFCVLGSTCPYQHGQDHMVATSKDDEYDPTKSNILDATNGTNGHGGWRGGERGRGRGRGRGDRGSHLPRRNRADFSHAGPNEDRAITTIVVEQIPEDKFNEDSIRAFFSEFGTISDVTLKPFKNLAIVKFDSYDEAHRAWSSPKVIFDNRFVKVYWYKPADSQPDTNGNKPSTGQTEDVPFDREAFEKQQAEAQKAHEEKVRKRKETEEAILEHKKRTDEFLKRQQEEKAKLMEKLGEKSGELGANNGTQSPGNSQTAALRSQLAALEAEAKILGIDPNSQADPSYSRGRGRGFGVPRGRGGFPPRGRGYDPSHRGQRGRGGFRGRGGVLRLDNRPKRVAISGVNFDANSDEALRQYLLGIGEYDSIDPNPDQPGSLIVSFKDRYIAEQLFHGASEIPAVGKVEFAWVNKPAPLPTTPASEPEQKQDGDRETGANKEAQGMLPHEKEGAHEVDYDVAEMDDWEME